MFIQCTCISVVHYCAGSLWLVFGLEVPKAAGAVWGNVAEGTFSSPGPRYQLWKWCAGNTRAAVSVASKQWPPPTKSCGSWDTRR